MHCIARCLPALGALLIHNNVPIMIQRIIYVKTIVSQSCILTKPCDKVSISCICVQLSSCTPSTTRRQPGTPASSAKAGRGIGCESRAVPAAVSARGPRATRHERAGHWGGVPGKAVGGRMRSCGKVDAAGRSRIGPPAARMARSQKTRRATTYWWPSRRVICVVLAYQALRGKHGPRRMSISVAARFFSRKLPGL